MPENAGPQDNTLENYKIVKVGRGTSKPLKYRQCANCGNTITDFRIDVIENGGESTRTYYCVHCIFKAFLDEQQKPKPWSKKLMNLFLIRN